MENRLYTILHLQERLSQYDGFEGSDCWKKKVFDKFVISAGSLIKEKFWELSALVHLKKIKN